MTRKYLQKLAGLLKEAEDFDLSDNPIPANTKISFTLTKEPQVIYSKDFTIDIKDFATYVKGELNDGEKLDLEDSEELGNMLADYLENNDMLDDDTEAQGWTYQGYSDYNDYTQYTVDDLEEKDYKKLGKYLKKR